MPTSSWPRPQKPRQLFILPLLFLLLLAPLATQAQESRIPSELQQWIPWVLYEQEEVLCTLRAESTTSRYCSWPSSLELSVDDSGGKFSQRWLVETRTLVPLPGNSPLWPKKVTVDGKEILLSKIKGRPAVWLDSGAHSIRGEFSWATLPENIYIPPATGLVQLSVMGKEVQDMQLDTKGKLWFKSQEKVPKKSKESLGVQVFRKIEDGVPLRQELVILLTVSGTPRQITLGLKENPAFVPLQVISPLPARLDKSGRLTLQVRPGQWRIKMILRNTLPSSPKTLTIGNIDGTWPSREIWVFAANPKLRQISIAGVAAVDPTRTALPKEWQKFPAYLIKSGESMTLIQKNRGNSSPIPNRLSLKRKIWLDEDGGGLTVKDEIKGIMTKGWRLSTQPSQLLGRVTVGGSPQLITRLQGSPDSGVEVRQGKLNLTAESRIQLPVQSGQLQLPALGWNHTVQNLSVELYLPPGWSLLATSGVDKVSTWITRWTLLDIFLVLIIALATAHILGAGWGVLGLLFLVLSYHQPGSPKYLWLILLALLAIQKLIIPGTGKQICKLTIVLILGILTISAIPFVIHEVRIAIYPQLEYGNGRRIVRQEYRERRRNQDNRVQEEGIAASMDSSSVSQRSPIQKNRYSLAPSKSKAIEIDPKDMIQTGPGLPAWQWKRIHLSWNGPVNPEQKISLYLLSPLNNSIAALLRVLLLILFLGGFFRYFLRHPSLKATSPQAPKSPGRAKTALSSKATTTLALFFCLFSLLGPTISTAVAEVPPPEILKELQNRLLAPPKCGEDCVTINSCTVAIDNNTLLVTLELDSLIRMAVPLPGKNRFFDQIILDTKTATILRLDTKQYPLIRVEPGRHTILLKKELSGLNSLSFSFPLRPENGQALLNNWSISGLYDDGRLDKQLSLKRIASATGDAEGKVRDRNSIEIPAFVRVERRLHMGLKWTVSTRIIRLSPETAIALDIPLIPGEQVTTAGLQIKDRQLRINMGPEQQSFSFQSSMNPVDTLRLNAAKTTSWTEVWFLDVSPIWHVTAKGPPEINQTNPAGKRYPEYHPYPGETLDLTISRPAGIPGPSMTVTSSKRVIKPGIRTTETSLFLSLNASRGLQHSITLPPGIELQRTIIDGKELSLQLEGSKLRLPLLPGKQDIEIGWRSPHGVATRKLLTETVDIGLPSVNASIELNVPSSRWILFTGGPRIGPAVLFWGELLVIILIAIFLGQVALTPLGTLSWLLLSIGLSQVPIPVAAIVVAWLLLLGLRKKRGHEIKSATSFNFLQVALVFLSILAMAALFYAIQQGLLGHPDMQIGGNGSSGHILRWYQDRAVSQLPNAWVISVPLLAYRISMLLWALWLAMALLGWIRWGWQCFSEGTVWKKPPPRPKKKSMPIRKRAAPSRSTRPVKTAKIVVRKVPVNTAVPSEARTQRPKSSQTVPKQP